MNPCFSAGRDAPLARPTKSAATGRPLTRDDADRVGGVVAAREGLPRSYAAGLPRGSWLWALLPLCTLLGCLAARGEEWFKVYDQTSRIGGEMPGPYGGAFALSTNSPFGQTFTPASSGIDFVEMCFLTSPRAGEADTQTIGLRLREGTIDGPVLGFAAPVFMTNRGPAAVDFVEFTFPNRLELIPGNRYAFEFAHLDGTDLIMVVADSTHVRGGDYYLGGNMIYKGMDYHGYDVWFREGILVPEPGTAVLLALGGLGLWAALRPARRSLGAGGCRAPPP